MPEDSGGIGTATDILERSLTDMYGYAYRRAHESGARLGTTTLISQFRDGSTHAEDVATYFSGPESWLPLDRMACERAVGRVLAIGCGPGRHALEVARAGHQVVGLEPSVDAVTVARDRGLETRLGSILDLPDDLGTFDTFLLAGGGLHLLFLPEHRQEVFAQLAGIANAGAQILGTCPLFVDGGDDIDSWAFWSWDNNQAYRIRVEHGDERTLWSAWGSVAFLPPEHLHDMVHATPWMVEEIHQMTAPGVPSYLAHLRFPT